MTHQDLTIRQILLATDFSKFSRRAEAMTCTQARAFGAQVTVLHAIEPLMEDATADSTGDDDLDAFYDELAGRAREELDEVVGRLEAGGVHAIGCLVRGERWRMIVEYADSHNIDLVVLGSHGVYDDGRPYVGTTSHRVLFGSAVPVLVVRWDDT